MVFITRKPIFQGINEEITSKNSKFNTPACHHPKSCDVSLWQIISKTILKKSVYTFQPDVVIQNPFQKLIEMWCSKQLPNFLANFIH